MDKKKNGQDHTILGSSASFKGDLQCAGDLRIDGAIEGNIISQGRLVIGEDAKIGGNIRCKSAEIYGNVNGDIHCDDLLTLKATSKVKGNIKVKQFAVEQGCVLDGTTIDMRGDSYQSAQVTQPAEQKEG